MRKILIIGLTSLSLISCGGKKCLTCSQSTYWNGINYVERPNTIFCQEDDESDADFEIRLKEHEEKGYYCKEK